MGYKPKLDEIEDAVRKAIRPEGLPEGFNFEKAISSVRIELMQRRTWNSKESRYIPLVEKGTVLDFSGPVIEMCYMGLTPLHEQCYFIPRKGTIQLHVAYLGNKALLMRVPDVRDFWARCVFKDDEFEYSIDNGNITIEKHRQEIENRDPLSREGSGGENEYDSQKESDIRFDHIRAAYGILEWRDGRRMTHILSHREIAERWEAGQHYDDLSNAQKKSPNACAARTVMNYVAKYYIRAMPELMSMLGDMVLPDYQSDMVGTDRERVQTSMKADEVMDNHDPITIPSKGGSVETSDISDTGSDTSDNEPDDSESFQSGADGQTDSSDNSDKGGDAPF